MLPYLNYWHWYLESGPTLIALEFINYELKFDLNSPYTHIEEIIGMFDERDNATDNCAMNPLGIVVREY